MLARHIYHRQLKTLRPRIALGQDNFSKKSIYMLNCEKLNLVCWYGIP